MLKIDFSLFVVFFSYHSTVALCSVMWSCRAGSFCAKLFISFERVSKKKAKANYLIIIFRKLFFYNWGSVCRETCIVKAFRATFKKPNFRTDHNRQFSILKQSFFIHKALENVFFLLLAPTRQAEKVSAPRGFWCENVCMCSSSMEGSINFSSARFQKVLFVKSLCAHQTLPPRRSQFNPFLMTKGI